MIFAFSFFNKYLQKRKSQFSFLPPICAYAPQRVNARDFDKGVPLFYCAQRAEPSNHGVSQASARRETREQSLEKVKITLLTFSPCAEAQAGKVNAARVLWCAPKERAAEENSKRRAAKKRRTLGLSSNSRNFLLSAQKKIREYHFLYTAPLLAEETCAR